VYDDCQKENSLYQPTFVAPMIPINGFGHVYILKRLGLVEKYENLFESVRMQAGPHRQIENNPDVAKFMWGEKEFVPQIDDLDRLLASDEFSYITCPIKFSIGAILFDRDTWKNLMYFIPGTDPSMGLDETQLCQYAMLESKPIIVSQNTCVGHLSFGRQNAEMKKYFLEHRDIFEIKNKTKENA
ncbi:MAG: hypothetical protein KIG16_05010, partial [Eubacteriales bacterium]|nr:hypothetical protein [Eubacteriales bacterium]